MSAALAAQPGQAGSAAPGPQAEQETLPEDLPPIPGLAVARVAAERMKFYLGTHVSGDQVRVNILRGRIRYYTETDDDVPAGLVGELEDELDALLECIRFTRERAEAAEARVREQREAIAAMVESMVARYPEDVFLEPGAGKHAATVDGCSARALRRMLPLVAQEIREMELEGK